ncbi:amidohydrolase family protein [uncultured Croceitalea sp.]|uniref:amidohydrolase family protein n=1 Tax=uncultured Croceitalea sp. TaxID=1798908 RepID=UPI0033059FCA
MTNDNRPKSSENLMRRLKILLAAFIFSSCSMVETYDGPIIDVHMHAFGYDRYGLPVPPNPSTQIIPAASSDQEVIELTLKEIDRLNIEQAWISGPLENVKVWKERSPNKFMGGLYYHPRNPLPELDKVKNNFQEGTIGVFGELGLAYGGLTPNDSVLQPYFELAEANGIPVGIHMALGEPNLSLTWAPKFRVACVNPLIIEELVIKYPKLKIYLMHAGWPFLDETKAIMCMFDNVYADLSLINWLMPDNEFQNYVRGLTNMDGVECDLTKRLMYGSDQMVWPDAMELSINNIQKISFLSKEQKADIFYNNAKRFLSR